MDKIRATKALVGGVNSPVRNFGRVSSNMVFAAKTNGAHLWDTDGNKYIDYIMSWGVSILGHAVPSVIETVRKTLEYGTSFGLTTEAEIVLAEKVKQHFDSIEKIRFVSSGTEACMSAVRLARAYTGKKKIIKFDGAYHGHFDGLLVKSGSGNLTYGIPSGEGILDDFTANTISVPFNDKTILKDVISTNRGEIACIILEPVLCNTGVILPEEGFLSFISEETKTEDILLILDEIITGFRLSIGGAQKLYNIKPDLTCLGKILGAGFPVAAYGGRNDIMNLVSPEGPVYQAGTLSGNPVSMAAGIKMLEEIEMDKSLYADLEKKTIQLVSTITSEARKRSIPITVNSIGSLFSVFLTEQSVDNYTDAAGADRDKYAKVFNYMLQNGILFPPSPFESCFMSRAHGEEDIDKTAELFIKGLVS